MKQSHTPPTIPSSSSRSILESQNLAATFVRCTPGPDFDAEGARAIAERARPMFEGMPGLHSKLFSFNAGGREVVNVYLWESMDAATAFFNPQVIDLIAKTYGVVPEVRFAEVSGVVENHNVQEFSRPH